MRILWKSCGQTKLKSKRVILSVAVNISWPLHQLDVKSILFVWRIELKKKVFGNSNDAHSETLVARGKDKEYGLNSNRGNSRSKSKTRNNTCNYCRKERHWKVDCLELEDKYYSSSNFGTSANVVDNAIKFVLWWMFDCTKIETRNLVF